MFRKILLPALAIGLLGGCVSSGYRYDSGGYYYGQPSTSYRYYDGYYNNYRYPGYYGSLNYRYGYPGYGYPGYRYPGYGYPGYGYGGGYYRPPVVIVRPGYGDNHGNRPPTGDRNDRAPWRDYERLQRERIQRSTPPTGNRPSSAVMRDPVPAQPRPAAAPSRPAAPPSQGSRNSRSDRMIERARSSRQVE